MADEGPIAVLSMYDWPETEQVLDQFWALISKALLARGLPAPAHLTHTDEPYPLWRSDNLCIGQTCGWPYATKLRDLVHVFGRFDFGLPGCPPGCYNSVIVSSSNTGGFDLNTVANAQTIAINGDDSQSGFHVFAELSEKTADQLIAEEKRLITGAHRESIKAVAMGEAEIAAIDAVAYELAKIHDPEIVGKTHEIGRSKPMPGLPLITGKGYEANLKALYEAVKEAFDGLEERDRQALLVKSVLPAKGEDYSVFLNSQNG